MQSFSYPAAEVGFELLQLNASVITNGWVFLNFHPFINVKKNRKIVICLFINFFNKYKKLLYFILKKLINNEVCVHLLMRACVRACIHEFIRLLIQTRLYFFLKKKSKRWSLSGKNKFQFFSLVLFIEENIFAWFFYGSLDYLETTFKYRIHSWKLLFQIIGFV